MKKILVDGTEVESLNLESLPMLIHGKQGSGASLYTICLAAKWFTQGNKVIFLCGYPMAEQEFEHQVGHKHTSAQFFTQDKLREFIEELKDVTNDTIVIVKNIELFDENLFEAVKDLHNLIVSGEIDKFVSKNQLLSKTFTTKVYFSPLEGKEVPQLEKYHGYSVSADVKGIASLRD